MNKISYTNYHRDEDYLKFESQFRNIFTGRLLLIHRCISSKKEKGKRVLDVGCSVGIFLDLFKERGWETWGVEPSKSALVARKKGHKIINEFFEKAKLPEECFDLVVLNHTLEHMDKPLEVLKKAKGLLKEEGILYVDVPNAGGISARIMGQRWPYLAPEEHKHQFTKESLTKVMRDAGFKVLHFESRSGICEYANPFLELWEALTGLKKRFFKDLVTFPYALLATFLNMGDSMSMIGQRT